MFVDVQLHECERSPRLLDGRFVIAGHFEISVWMGAGLSKASVNYWELEARAEAPGPYNLVSMEICGSWRGLGADAARGALFWS